MRRLALPLPLLLLLAVPTTLGADEVHLVNGNSFEGVIATVEGSKVRIRLPHGELSLPMSRVERIDKAAAPLEAYLERKRELLAGEPSAADWLELARWARRHELGHGVRESALAAARLDPTLEGLAPLLTELGYVFDEASGEWMSYAEHMDAEGFVRIGGVWVSREEIEARRREREEARAQRREQASERLAELALETAIEARVQAEVAREVARTEAARSHVSHALPFVLGTFPVHFFTPRDPARPSPEMQRREFLPPPQKVILERDFGGSLGSGPAPGRLRSASSNR